VIESIIRKFQIKTYSDLEKFKIYQYFQVACLELTESEKFRFFHFLKQNGIYVEFPSAALRNQLESPETSYYSTLGITSRSSTLERLDDPSSHVLTVENAYTHQTSSPFEIEMITKSYSLIREFGLESIINSNLYHRKMKWVKYGSDISRNMSQPDGTCLGTGQFSTSHGELHIDPDEYYIPIGPLKSCLEYARKEGWIVATDKRTDMSPNRNRNRNRNNAPTLPSKYFHTNTYTKTKKNKLGIKCYLGPGEICYYVNLRQTLCMIKEDLKYSNVETTDWAADISSYTNDRLKPAIETVYKDNFDTMSPCEIHKNMYDARFSNSVVDTTNSEQNGYEYILSNEDISSNQTTNEYDTKHRSNTDIYSLGQEFLEAVRTQKNDRLSLEEERVYQATEAQVTQFLSAYENSKNAPCSSTITGSSTQMDGKYDDLDLEDMTNLFLNDDLIFQFSK
jgi:hypothetical protein